MRCLLIHLIPVIVAVTATVSVTINVAATVTEIVDVLLRMFLCSLTLEIHLFLSFLTF